MSSIDCESSAAKADVSVVRASVSFASEQLILVDSDDREIGYRSKSEAHAGAGILHRAFSAFLFDDQGRLLVHRRSLQKPLWPGFWTNSCCSHPRRGESLESAVSRRITEELGVNAQTQFVYKFEYHAKFEDVGSEHELCHVFLARTATPGKISAHAEEVMEWQWLSVEEVDAWLLERPDDLTPWFRQEWLSLRTLYRAELDAFVNEVRNSTQRGAA
ncbi:isopentenyl-diphosphate Delta-isomerase [Congregibacter variabilis]|uniref:Isopentenyl-diphosphate Delta-isomerase n=1 Tax=Congregibacter variabilis TaxID=3081200 RepID=A0ABZ0I372_9GAMM|nr:isopentenyl-diphosphate Delta-isomerase [Congregibacter sp. IMCC43200]